MSREFGFLLATAGMTWFLVTQVAEQIPGGLPVVVAITALFNLMLFRPWRVTLNVDMDTESCRVDVRLFGMLPILRRQHELSGRRLAVERRHETKEVEGSSGLGCLMMALPFPLSLLSMMFGGGSKSVQRQSWSVLCLRGSGRESTADLIPIDDDEVVAQLLEAVRDLLPGHVE